MSGAGGFVGRVTQALRMVKVSHTIFAMPFAVAAVLLAARGVPSVQVLLWVVVAMVSARTAAMAFNRLVDRKIDARNPRTAERVLASGDLTPKFVVGLILVCSALFFLSTAMLNRTVLLLSPFLLAFMLSYSWAKRFTSLCHLWLGCALGLSPIAAWLAVRPQIDGDFVTPVVMGIAVTFWVAGFDLIYACQDIEFDRREKLHSLPAKLGIPGALRLAALLHFLAFAALLALTWAADLGALYLASCTLVAVLLVVEHRIARRGDPRNLRVAFFHVNSWVGMVALGGIAGDVLW